MNIIVIKGKNVLSDAEIREKAKALASLEEIIISLADKVNGEARIHDVDISKKGRLRRSIDLSMPLFYKEHLHVTMLFGDADKAQNKELIGVETGCELEFVSVYSDTETCEAFEKLLQENKIKSLFFFVGAKYYFNKEGYAAKIVNIPNEIPTNREPLFEHELGREIKSPMTAEDFLYAERALTVIKDRIEDYLKWSKQPQS